MPKKKSNKFEFRGFINLVFDGEKIQALEAYQASVNSDLADNLTVIAEYGHKVAISFNDYTGTLSIALTIKDSTSAYYGYCITLQHRDVNRLGVACRWLTEEGMPQGMIPLPDEGDKYDW